MVNISCIMGQIVDLAIMNSINPVTGPLGLSRAAHLLRRVTFGPTVPAVSTMATLTVAQAMSALLVADTSTDKPLDNDGSGTSFLDQPYSSVGPFTRFTGVQNFWIRKMQLDNTAFYATLLFWNNHFAIALPGGQKYTQGFKYYRLLQKHTLGNFRDFVIEMTKDPLMLLWLNGNENKKAASGIASNENYARELQELFTIGATRPDGTPNYTEDDVQAAARVLTGWQITNPNGNLADLGSQFTLSRHDIGVKTFSNLYNNATITGQNNPATGETELAALVDMILAQPETARFICRKLYRWFVAAPITADIEIGIIEPLAVTFRQANYAIAPVLAQLFSSEHFYGIDVQGSIIKHPLDVALGLFRLTNMPLPDPVSQTLAFNNTMNKGIRQPVSLQQMDIMRHETVFGWDAYYQPDYYKLWINSSSLRQRFTLVDLLLNGYTLNGFKVSFDPIVLTETLLAAVGYVFSNKASPNANDKLLGTRIIEGYCFYFYPKPCLPDEIVTLRETLLFQGALNETGFWFEWKYYVDGDTAAKNGMKTRLTSLLRYFWKSPAFHLK